MVYRESNEWQKAEEDMTADVKKTTQDKRDLIVKKGLKKDELILAVTKLKHKTKQIDTCVREREVLGQHIYIYIYIYI